MVLVLISQQPRLDPRQHAGLRLGKPFLPGALIGYAQPVPDPLSLSKLHLNGDFMHHDLDRLNLQKRRLP